MSISRSVVSSTFYPTCYENRNKLLGIKQVYIDTYLGTDEIEYFDVYQKLRRSKDRALWTPCINMK